MPPLPPDMPSLATCWIVTILFALVMFGAGLQNFRPAHDGRFVMNGSAVQYWLILAASAGRVLWLVYCLAQQHNEAAELRLPRPAMPNRGRSEYQLRLRREAHRVCAHRQNGQKFDSDSLHGKVWVGSFFFTNCPGSCWRLNQALADMQRATPGSPVQYVSITCDPENDKPEALLKYAAALQGRPGAVEFLDRQTFHDPPDRQRLFSKSRSRNKPTPTAPLSSIATARSAADFA